ncbi:Hsp33 family molecular chaperone HslO [Sporosarcina sp. A2]|uniref:Hsp33 family molecular chaperone HslO n=1 Tax=Sporosarcina sp. A2 TaxID=3393449 RepID=UPI003D78FDAF
MGDYLVKAIAYEGQLRAYSVITTEIVEEARRRHDTLRASTEALGQMLTAGVMLGMTLKGADKLTMKVNGGGPIGTVSVDANADGEVRGYVANPKMGLDFTELDQLDVETAIGSDGVFSVSKYIGLHAPFVGQVPLGSGAIVDDFSLYLNNSEQTPSIVSMGVRLDADSNVQFAGGIIIQMMPGASEELFERVKAYVQDMESIPSLLAQDAKPENLLREIMGADQLTILEQIPVRFQCQCSEERISNAIISLGKEEIYDMIHTDGQAEANCHYCNESYFFTKEELEKLMSEAS